LKFLGLDEKNCLVFVGFHFEIDLVLENRNEIIISGTKCDIHVVKTKVDASKTIGFIKFK
jgi:hypothetical protein